MRYVNTHMKRMMYMPPYSVHAEPCSAWSDDLEMLSGRYLLHIFTKTSECLGRDICGFSIFIKICV